MKRKWFFASAIMVGTMAGSVALVASCNKDSDSKKIEDLAKNMCECLKASNRESAKMSVCWELEGDEFSEPFMVAIKAAGCDPEEWY
jgi:hypothetical protein